MGRRKKIHQPAPGHGPAAVPGGAPEGVLLPGRSVRGSWVEMLERFDFDWFVTLTFGRPPADAIEAGWWFDDWLREGVIAMAIRRGHIERRPDHVVEDGYRREVKRLRRLGGPGYRWLQQGQLDPVWVRAFERHESGKWHVHALVAEPPKLRDWNAAALERLSIQMDIGRSEVARPDKRIALKWYTTKEIYNPDGGLELSPNFPSFDGSGLAGPIQHRTDPPPRGSFPT